MEKLSYKEWADILKSFYEDNGPEYKTATIEHIKETILTSPMAEETFIEDDEALEIAQQVFKLWQDEEQEEQTPFNNPDLFVKEFKKYLIGKNIGAAGKNLSNGTYKIVDVSLTRIGDEDENYILPYITVEGNGVKDFSLNIPEDEFQKFIDGETINLKDDDFQLILQEDKKYESLYNKPEYRYYVINKDNKILSGFEYKEDAISDAERKQMYGESVLVVGKKDLLEKQINPDCNDCWSVNEHDWAIIETCLNKCSDEGGCSPKEATKYLKEFKEESKHLNVIKGALLQCLERAQIKLRGAYAMSNLESVNEKCDENCRIQKELKRLIAMEK